MDFFEHQDRARKKTGRYLALFGLAVVLINVVIYFVAVIVFSYGAHDPEQGPTVVFSWWNPSIFFMTCLGVTTLIGLGSLYKIHQLSQGGGKTVAEMLGGRLVPRHATDLDERKLLNVVEEMAIASGVPVPDVYILEDQAINAFAAGNTISDCVVGVTRGCIRSLSRDELQGVVAHEFSHILNGDMRMNIRLMGILHGILLIAIVGYLMFRFAGSVSRGSSSRDKGGGAAIALGVFLLGLTIYVIGYIGIFFANLIKAAVSRQREFLADASAVQFTRNPGGISGALKKIMGTGSRLSSEHAPEASHLFFSSSLSGFWSNLFATHPPLPDRIRAIEGSQANLMAAAQETKRYTAASAAAAAEKAPKAGGGARKGPLSSLPPVIPGGVPGDNALRDTLGVSSLAGAGIQASTPNSEDTVSRGAMEQVAAGPQAQHIDFAGNYLGSLPPEILTATRDAFSARAVALHLLLTGDNHEGMDKSALLEPIIDSPLLQEFNSLQNAFSLIDLDQRLPLLDICIPSLKHLSPDQYKQFRAQIAQVIAADGQVDFLEFCLERTLLRHLDIYYKLLPPPRVEYLSLDAVSPDCRALVSCLAHIGSQDAPEADRAYQAGWQTLDMHDRYPLLPFEECHLERLDQALDKLSRLSPPLKGRFLQACAATVLSNSQINTYEAELVRAYAENLDCPLPPLTAVA